MGVIVAASSSGSIGQAIAGLLSLYAAIIFVMLVMSWFPLREGGGAAQVYRFLLRITDPVIMPVRRAMPSTGPLDLSPLVVLLVIELLRRLILS